MLVTLTMMVSLIGQTPAPAAFLVGLGAPALGGFATAIQSAEERFRAAADASERATRERRSLVARRRSKRAAAYIRRANDEAAEAQSLAAAQERARAEYLRMLPYALEARRQDMSYAAQTQSAQAIAGAIKQAAGYSQGTYVPPRVINAP